MHLPNFGQDDIVIKFGSGIGYTINIGWKVASLQDSTPVRP